MPRLHEIDYQVHTLGLSGAKSVELPRVSVTERGCVAAAIDCLVREGLGGTADQYWQGSVPESSDWPRSTSALRAVDGLSAVACQVTCPSVSG